MLLATGFVTHSILVWVRNDLGYVIFMLVIKPKIIKPEQFNSLGVILRVPNVPPPKQGDDWDCWNKLAHLGPGNPSIGIVKTRPNSLPVVAMERHHKQELLIPITGPIIQPLVPASDNSNLDAKPAASKAEAFIIYPGEAVIISSGVWHCAAIPLDKQEIIYFYLTEPSSDDVSFGGWINFQNNESISLDYGENEWM